MDKERVDVRPGQRYTFRMPASEAMISCGKHGDLQELMVKKHIRDWGVTWEVLFWRPPYNTVYFGKQEGGWYSSGYTYSECGLYQDGDRLYGYLPDLSDSPEEFKRQTAEVATKLRAALMAGGAIVASVAELSDRNVLPDDTEEGQ